MKKKEIISFITWLLLLIPFFKTDFMSRYGIIDSIMNIWKIVSIFCAFLIFLKRGKLSKKIVLLMIFNGWLIITTVLNEGDFQQCFLFSITILALAILFENRIRGYQNIFIRYFILL